METKKILVIILFINSVIMFYFGFKYKQTSLLLNRYFFIFFFFFIFILMYLIVSIIRENPCFLQIKEKTDQTNHKKVVKSRLILIFFTWLFVVSFLFVFKKDIFFKKDYSHYVIGFLVGTFAAIVYSFVRLKKEK